MNWPHDFFVALLGTVVGVALIYIRAYWQIRQRDRGVNRAEWAEYYRGRAEELDDE